MFQEFPHVKQEAGGGHRRWFAGDGMELITWFDAEAHLEGFQLCYPGAGRREHALTWRVGGGFAHHQVESGDSRPDKNLTPILVPDGAVPWEKLRRDFGNCSERLEPPLREFIIARLAEGAT